MFFGSYKVAAFLGVAMGSQGKVRRNSSLVHMNLLIQIPRMTRQDLKHSPTEEN